VIACASTDDKLAVCREHGADDTINYATEISASASRRCRGRGADVVYDPVGGSYTELALRSIAWRGRLLVVGFAAGEIRRSAQPHPAQGLFPSSASSGRLGAPRAGAFRRKPWRGSIAGMRTASSSRTSRPRSRSSAPPTRLTLMASRKVTGKVVLTVG